MKERVVLCCLHICQFGDRQRHLPPGPHHGSSRTCWRRRSPLPHTPSCIPNRKNGWRISCAKPETVGGEIGWRRGGRAGGACAAWNPPGTGPRAIGAVIAPGGIVRLAFPSAVCCQLRRAGCWRPFAAGRLSGRWPARCFASRSTSPCRRGSRRLPPPCATAASRAKPRSSNRAR